MKAKTLLISALSLGLLIILAGCEETAPTFPNQRGAQNTPAQSAAINTNNPAATATSTASVNVLPGADVSQNPTNPTATPPDASQISQADQTAYNGAVQLKDPTFCDKIKDEAYMKACKTNLVNLQAQDEAVTKLDPTLCARLSTKDAQDACKMQIDVSKKEIEISENQQVLIKTNLELYNSILEKKNFADCGKLTEAALLNSCKASALAIEAETKNDITVCSKASNTTDIANCKQAFQDWTSGAKTPN